MRKKNQKIRCEKQRLPKFKGLCKTYDKVQTAMAVVLSQQEDVVCIRCNVDSAVIDGKEYTTDFVCEMANGELAVRECLYRRYITKPLNLKVLEASRKFWLKRGVKDWAIVVNEKSALDSSECAD